MILTLAQQETSLRLLSTLSGPTLCQILFLVVRVCMLACQPYIALAQSTPAPKKVSFSNQLPVRLKQLPTSLKDCMSAL